jgi:hypothetical protein
MTDVRVASLGARVRRVRREAASRGMLVRKSRNDPNLHRYIMVEREPHRIKRSHNLQFPYSFSLEEAETYLTIRL